jgi:hypothetical protein
LLYDLDERGLIDRLDVGSAVLLLNCVAVELVRRATHVLKALEATRL